MIGSYALWFCVILCSCLFSYGIFVDIEKQSNLNFEHLDPLNDKAKNLRYLTTELHANIQDEFYGGKKQNRNTISHSIATIRKTEGSIISHTKALVASNKTFNNISLDRLIENTKIFLNSTQQIITTMNQSTGVGSESDIEFDALYDHLVELLHKESFLNPHRDEQIQRDIGHAKYLLAHGHLITAEILGGDFGEDFNEVISSFQGAYQIFKKYQSSLENKNELDKGIPKLISLAQSRYDTMLENHLRNKGAIQDFDQSFKQLHLIVTNIEQLISKEVKNNQNHAQKLFNTAKTILTAILPISLIFGVLLSFNIFRHLIRPFDYLITDIKRFIDHNEIHKTPCLHRNDEIGTLANVVEELKITEKNKNKVMENLKAAKKAADDANLAKSQFLANMSHEIRTPLNAIIGYSDILVEDEISHEQRTMLNSVKESSATLLQLVNDILDLAKIESRELQLEHIPTNLEDLVFEVMESQISKTINKPVELNVDMGETYALVYSDPTRLKQIIMNLVGNAVKFTDSGEVLVRCRSIFENDERQRLKFEVIDTGIGMDEKESKHIFEAFRQADGSTTRKYGGTGLGLNISKKILKALGAELSLQSTKGKGSNFSFELELKKHIPDQASQLQDQNLELLTNDKILLVDDNASVHGIVQHYFKKKKLSLKSSFSVEEGLEVIKHNNISIVLLDIMMPQQDGFDFHREAINLNPNLKFIVITADIRPNTISRLKNDGFDSYLIKPIRKRNLFLSLLQLKNKKATTVTTDQQLNHNFESANLLVVDDNPMNLKVAEKTLKKMGHLVTTAKSGKEAIELTQEQIYDLIFMDMQMPNMSGVEATIELRRQNYSHPIIALTANAFESDRQQCLNAGMDDFITKPLKRDLLHKMIQKHTQTHGDFIEKRIIIAGGTHENLQEVSDIIVQQYPSATIKIRNQIHHLNSTIGSFAPHIVIISDQLRNLDPQEWLSYMAQHQKRNIKIYWISPSQKTNNPLNSNEHELNIQQIEGELSSSLPQLMKNLNIDFTK